MSARRHPALLMDFLSETHRIPSTHRNTRQALSRNQFLNSSRDCSTSAHTTITLRKKVPTTYPTGACTAAGIMPRQEKTHIHTLSTSYSQLLRLGTRLRTVFLYICLSRGVENHISVGGSVDFHFFDNYMF